MAEPISIQQLKDASEDAISLAEFINKPENVMIPRRLASDIHSLQYYLEYMKSFAQRSYETYDEMVANSGNLSENVSVFVTNDSDTSKNGIYTYNGTSFVKGEYQPENAAKEFVEAKLGGLEVFDGKVRDEDVSTSDGSTQADKNTEFRNELDDLPFENGVLADTFVTVTPNGVGTVPRTQRDKNSESLSVKDFGAKGDGVTDDTLAMQAALDYCFDKKVTCFIPAGTYKTTLPLIVRGSNKQSGGSGGAVLKGESRDSVLIVKHGNAFDTTLATRLQEDAVMIFADADLIGEVNSQARHLVVSGFTLKGQSTCEYGVYMPTGIIESEFSDIMTEKCVKAFWYAGAFIYLTNISRLRLTSCDYGLNIAVGINTSLNISNIYVVAAMVEAIRVVAQYSTIIQPSVDSCHGICYALGNFRGTVIAPGCESKNATIIFDFTTPSGPYVTDVVITNAQTNASAKPDSVHVNVGTGRVIFVGGRINNADGTTTVAGDKLIEFAQVSAAGRPSLKFINTFVNDFPTLPTRDKNGLSFQWEGLSNLYRTVQDKILPFLDSGHVLNRPYGRVYSVAGSNETTDAFGNITSGGYASGSGADGAAADIPDNDCNKALRTGMYFMAGEDTLNGPPSPYIYGCMIVMRRSTTAVIQMAVTGTGIRLRSTSDAGATWSAWTAVQSLPA